MSSILGGIAGNLASGNIGRAVVSMYLDTAGYNAQLEKTRATTVAATQQAGSATSKFGAISTAAYATAAVAAISFAKEAIASASEHEQVMAALTAQVGSNTQAFEQQATALQHVSGFQDEAILGADTILARFKLTEEQIRATIPTVLDYARATGKTAPDAAQTIGKALLGNTRALKAVGIQYTSTGDAAKDYANIQNLLNQKLSGQAAAYAQTFAGKLEILAADFDDLKEAVGGQLIDDLTVLADDFIILQQLADKLAASVPGGATAFNSLTEAVNPFNDAVSTASDIITWVGKQFGVTVDHTDLLTDRLGLTTNGLTLMSDAAYEAAGASHDLTKAQQDLVDAVANAGDGILSLTTTVKDTFNISQREMDKGFSNMLRAAVRFKHDMALLENLDLGLSPSKETAFEQFMVSQGPGYIDRFVNSSQQKQDKWVAQWERSVGAINKANAGINPITITVDTSQVDYAKAKVDRLREELSRVGI